MQATARREVFEMGCYYHPKLPTALRCRLCGHEICASCSEEGVCPGCRLGRAINVAAKRLPTVVVAEPRPSGPASAPAAAQASAPAVSAAATAPLNDSTEQSGEDRLLAALCYPVWPLALLLLLLPSGHNKFVRFHVLQSLGVNGLCVGLSVVYSLLANLPVIGWQSAVALPFLVPLWMLADLYLAIRAGTGQSPRVPFAADLASRFG